MTANPLVSVIMPVYNCPKYVSAAIESILAQNFADFEFIIIDDGSTDETPEVLRHYRDPRIRMVTQTNYGLTITLNRGIEMALGKYLARMDQDDISFPGRLDKQVEFMEANPRCGLVGTWSEIWVDDRPSGRFHKHPTNNLQLKFDLFFDNPFVHSSVMIRKSVLDKVGLYTTDTTRQPPEDYELWSRISRESEIANIGEILHIYREISTSMSRNGINPFLERVINIGCENIARVINKPVNQDIVDLVAFKHGAIYRLSEKPRFYEMINNFKIAVEILGNNCEQDTDVLLNQANEIIKSTRLQYLNYRYGKRIGKIMNLYDKLRSYYK